MTNGNVPIGHLFFAILVRISELEQGRDELTRLGLAFYYFVKLTPLFWCAKINNINYRKNYINSKMKKNL